MGEAPKENRGGDHVSAKSQPKRGKVREFIGKLPAKESHYNRAKSKRVYLAANLSVSKLCKMYNESVETCHQVKYSMFRDIFLRDFNIGFSSPASDVCSLCTRLKQQIRSEKDKSKKNELIMESRIHKKRAKAFYELCKEKPPNTLSFCFDLQQVQPLPRTAIGEGFYSHQVSFYAFCCTPMNSKKPTFYVWTEDLSGRGSTEVGSALLNYLDSLNFEEINYLRLFCDGCGGQNKNSYVIHALAFWLKTKAPEAIIDITVIYPVRGHSFLPADRVFWRVEKLLRKNPNITTKEEYIKFYEEVGVVKMLGKDWETYKIKDLLSVYNKIKGIASLKKINIKKKKAEKNSWHDVYVTGSEFFRFVLGNETSERILKKNKSDRNLILERAEYNRGLPEKKKNSLKKLLKENFGNYWEKQDNLKWYKDLLNSGTQNIDEIEEKEGDEVCVCLEEDIGLHV